jgi:hypothetical protein
VSASFANFIKKEDSGEFKVFKEETSDVGLIWRGLAKGVAKM